MIRLTPALLALACSSCSLMAPSVPRPDVYDAATTGYKLLDQCLITNLRQALSVSLDPEVLSDIAATRCLPVAQNQAAIIRHSRGSDYEKRKIAAPFNTHIAVKRRAMSIHAYVAAGYKKKESKGD